MIDFGNIELYRENNRIEAKKALGGLPESIWETYSAFANALGGVILLGVEEYRDHALHPVDLPDPERLVREFWAIINDKKRVSINILTESDVQILKAGDCRIIAVTVPRADRGDRPVYIDGDPFSGSYRRSGEGDYRCAREEVESMLRDAARSPAPAPLPGLTPDALDPAAVADYRARLERARPGHALLALSGTELLIRIGALTADGVHPTEAGLLMLGRAEALGAAFSNWGPEYRSGTENLCWEAGLLGFYFAVCPRLTGDLPQTVRRAAGEAAANCLIHADYRGIGAPCIEKQPRRLIFSNPGTLPMAADAARGGRTDPRNGALARMFHLIGIGTRAGSGLPGIYADWKRQGWAEPELEEHFAPDRTLLTLPLEPEAPDSRRPSPYPILRRMLRKAALVDYLTDHHQADTAELARLLEVQPALIRSLMLELEAENLVTIQGAGASRIYRLKW